MVTGRANELHYLNTVYARAGSQLLVVYGQKNIGKTTLLHEFAKGKDSFYHLAQPSGTRQQLYLFSQALRANGHTLPDYPDYDTVFEVIARPVSPGQKKVFIFDEWEHLIRNDDAFMEAVTKLLHHVYGQEDVLVILCSSAVGFVENGMVSKIGKAAHEITGFLKIKEQKFADVIRYFSSSSMEECILYYAILGGAPGLWHYFEPAHSLRENICNHILKPGSYLLEEGGRIVKEELRETSVYYTILAALAGGRCKLNELYLHTGFSRAKISVYLKNLMELEIVEKVFSIDTPGRDSQKKGVYRISNAFVRFWFSYIYPHLGDLYSMSADAYYRQHIEPTLLKYCDDCFSLVCQEYMMLSAGRQALPFKPEKTGIFDGKAGRIDFVGQNEEGKTICAFSSFSKPMVTYEDYKQGLTVIEQAKLSADYIYLFARGRFDEKLTLEAKVKGTVTLIGMDDL